MRYWKLELKYSKDNSSLVDSICLSSVICNNILFTSEVMYFPDGSEQLFETKKDAYILIWTNFKKQPFTRSLITKRAEQMIEIFVNDIERDFPEIMI
jgi:hypothetical protein